MAPTSTRPHGERSALHHYLLAIHHISLNKGVARTRDIALVLKIRPPSVTNMLERLSARHLILYKKYECARLAPEGEAIVKTLTARAAVFMRFLQRIGAPAHLVEQDAQALESGLSGPTMRQMERFVRFIDLFGEDPCFLAYFRRYCAGEMPWRERPPYCGLKVVENKGPKSPKRARTK
ncbi:Transcriptional regulator MntR [uncultured archaeon]|nr:Transcriptional regulator MntR [uncultured archaeon]